MPHPGYRQSAEHIRRRQESILAQGTRQFFSFLLMLDTEDRRDIIAERLAEAEQIVAESERLLQSRAGRRRRVRNSASDPLEHFRKELLRDIKALIALRSEGKPMRDSASTPYISPTDTRHPPMTTGPDGHVHDHAAFGAPDHDDGVHSHRHTHEGDADHDHSHRRTGGSGRAAPSSDQQVSGSYGRQMNAIGPLERRRLRDAQLAEHEARRGGSA